MNIRREKDGSRMNISREKDGSRMNISREKDGSGTNIGCEEGSSKTNIGCKEGGSETSISCEKGSSGSDRKWLEAGAAGYGTPSYIFNIDDLRQNVERFRRTLRGRAGLCFAMKANPFLAGWMAAMVDRIEVCSMGEFQICQAQRLPPEKLLISGVLKKPEDLEQILDTCRGRCDYTAESPEQFLELAKWAKANREVLRVYLRLTSGNQFGMDGEVIRKIVDGRKRWPYLRIQGIHYFSGTQKRKVEKIRKELELLDEFCAELEEQTGYPIEELEYGPGLAAVTFMDQKETGERDREAIAEAIGGMHWKGSVILEMGRALAADCGYYVTRVQETKQNCGKNYCLVDGGIHQMNYDGQIRGMYRPFFQVFPQKVEERIFQAEAGGQNVEKDVWRESINLEKTEDSTGKMTSDRKVWTVCGSLCTTNDVLMNEVPILGLKEGSLLVFERAGAYSMTEGMALFLSHPLPKILFYSEAMGWKLVRDMQPTYCLNMELQPETADYRNKEL